MSPDVGRYSPRISRPNVVLPDPVSPTSASVSPRLMASEIPSTALRVRCRPRPRPLWPTGKCLVTSTVSMTGTSAPGPGAGALPAGLSAGTARPVAGLTVQREAPGVRAAVDLQHRARDMARFCGGEEQYRVGDVAWVTGLAERDRADQGGPQVLGRPVRVGVTPATHVDVTGSDHVHPDAKRAQFHGEHLAHDLYRRLRRAVRGAARARAARGAGGDDDHCGTGGAAAGTVPRKSLGQQEGPGDVHREDPFPGRCGHVEQRSVRVGRRVVDEDIRLPEPADRDVENPPGDPRLGDIPGDAGDPR